ncbi:Exocyst subunit exo70 family protein A1 [Rhynchospora pubera]|uniref:Exocyst subunit Exo70 family protein n=1 Tax=Rhynchospora pubera TaxID=906938 RepID=A0AAV8GQF0_9POAL|nr:Exocyst subunit exo70 family protein A1 [Rhynchospora pubera]
MGQWSSTSNNLSSLSLSLSLSRSLLFFSFEIDRSNTNKQASENSLKIGENSRSAMEALRQRTEFLRESLEKSKILTETMVAKLGSFDSRLSTLDSAMRPIQARTHAVRTAHENIDKTLRSADVILSQFDKTHEAEKIIMRGPNEDLKGYLEAVDKLRSVARFFSSNKSYKSSDGVLSNVNSLLAKAISKMENEFQRQITSRSKAVDPDKLFDCLPSSLRPSSESPSHPSETGKNLTNGNLSEKQEVAVYTPPTLIDPRFVPLLSKLAQQLVQAGHHAQCLKLYRDARASALEMSLKNLGVEKLSKEEVQKMQWESLEAKIGNWIHFMRIAVKLLFAAERQLCNKIFEGVDSLKDECFAEVTSNSLSVLLSFGEAVAKSKRSPEKLFVLLDMYEIMRELQPDIEVIFEGKACREMQESALTLAKRLAQTAQETFTDFEEAVEKDATKTTVADGTVHPLTSYVINYVKFLFDYQSTLKQLFQEFGTSGDEANSQLATVTMRIMQALQTNLDAKSKQYKDQALTYLFLMNNIHYMVRSVRRSEAKDLLGDDWIQRHRRIVQQNANQYRRVAWAKVLQCISAQGLTSSGGTGVGESGSGGASRALIKDRFRSFNIQIEELYQRQCQWTVPDPELRESLRLAVAEILLPAYRSFIKRFGPLVENSKNPQKYIKYTPEDLEKMLGEFFEGKAAVEVRR